MKAAILGGVLGAMASLFACSYLDSHPPQVCITADAQTDAGDGGFRSVTLPAGWDAGSGGR